MFSSDLLDAGQAKPLRLFILSGLCIFVALFSTAVLERICRSRLKSKDQDHQTQVHQCIEEPIRKKENISPAVTIQSPEEKMTGRSRQKHEEQHFQNQVHQYIEEPVWKKENISPAVAIQSPEEEKMTGNQLKILETLAGVEGVKMTIADLLRHTMIPHKDFDEAISQMKAKGLVVQELSDSKKSQLILTTLGRQRVLIEFPLRVGHY
jgi:DNA-binding MarR family transcriptional regulator